MIAKEIISYELAPLHTTDTGEAALTMMNIYHVKHLPIVDEDQFLGLMSEEIILNNDLDKPIGSYSLGIARPFVNETEHIFEVMSKMAESNLTVVPVVDHNDDYLGLITQDDLIQYYAQSFSFSEPGSILVISTSKPNYSLAEISRIIESENAAILSTFLTTSNDTSEVQVTLKINRQDINDIIAAFQRFDYQITASFSEFAYIDDLKERYDSLMSYLNV
ncbi:MAG: CBS domain-containing protein [Saprospiraceae bacterium]